MGKTYFKIMVDSPKWIAALLRAMQIAGNPEFPPSTMDITFKSWAGRDLKVMDQLFHGNVLQPFEYLQEKLSLPRNDMFWYFQIMHYVTSYKDWNIIQNVPINIETYFMNLIEHQHPNKKYVSHIYRN